MGSDVYIGIKNPSVCNQEKIQLGANDSISCFWYIGYFMQCLITVSIVIAACVWAICAINY